MRRYAHRVAIAGIFGLSQISLGVGSGNTAEIVPVQSMAQGQALTGSTLLNDALYVNPASAAFTQAYSIDGAFYLPRTMAVSILDTKTSSIGGGLGYFRKSADELGAPDQTEQGAKLALMGRLSRVVGLGVAGKTIWGPKLAASPDTKVTDVDTGVILNFNPFQLGVSARNLFGGNKNIDEYREWSIGGQVNWEQTLFLSVATVSDWSRIAPYQYGVGVQYVSPYYFSLKGGYRIQPDNHLSFWSAGASFLSPRLSIHYSVEFPNQDRYLLDGKKVGIQHVIGATLLM